MVESSTKFTKVIVLGEERVGKTSLTLKFVKGSFDDHQEITINASNYSREIDVKGVKVNLNIWDTAG